MHVGGVLLFLFIPLVLYLFVQHPFGIVVSYSVAIVVMFTHRFVAIPFMNRFRECRCVWCGRRAAPGRAIEIESRRGAARFAVCDERCRDRLRCFAGFVDGHRRAIALAIFVPLATYVVLGFVRALASVGVSEPLERSLLQAPIALTVVSVAFLHRLGPEPEGRPRMPFPIHNLFLLGVRTTLVVFVGVGVFWLAQVVARALGAFTGV
ncbi:MAG: hypothetical protein HYR85_15215 [Planctomycetes bacterium]|nr:hypothetical protein [Planctomycetota bacterium]MBI3844554.1 hypothetical protein [Planctomycetota bacterium]